MIRFLFFWFILAVMFPAYAGEMVIKDVWVRAPIGQASVTAGYFTIQNPTGTDDRLISVQAPGVAKIEVHRTSMGEGGVMRMRPIQALAIPPGESVALSQGGDHLMLIGLATTLSDGDSLPLTVTFEQAGEHVVDARVARRNPFP